MADEFNDEIPPDNSSATVTPDGKVRTDKQKEPVTPEDVAKMAEAEVDLMDPKRPFRKGRTIVDHTGEL